MASAAHEKREETRETGKRKEGEHQAASEEAEKKVKVGEEGKAVLQPAHKEGTIMEKGLVYFFYRPKVELDETHALKDVQRLYLLICPGGTNKETMRAETAIKRLIVVGRKMLPEVVGAKGRAWCKVELVTKNIAEIDKVLGPYQYETATLGTRHDAAARPCGEGVYALVDEGRSTKFAYVLELPEDLGEAQEAFHIGKEGSYVMSIKNPDVAPTRPDVPVSDKHPGFPPELKREFGNRRWTKALPDFLNYDGAELLLLGASKDVEEDLGEAGAELKELEKNDARKLSDEKLFKELHMSKKVHPAESIKTGDFA